METELIVLLWYRVPSLHRTTGKVDSYKYVSYHWLVYPRFELVRLNKFFNLNSQKVVRIIFFYEVGINTTTEMILRTSFLLVQVRETLWRDTIVTHRNRGHPFFRLSSPEWIWVTINTTIRKDSWFKVPRSSSSPHERDRKWNLRRFRYWETRVGDSKTPPSGPSYQGSGSTRK